MPLDNLKCLHCGRKQGHRKTRLVPSPKGTESYISVPVVVCYGCKAASIGKVIVYTQEDPQRGRTPEAKSAYAREIRKLADQKRSEIECLRGHLVYIEEEAQRLEDEVRRERPADIKVEAQRIEDEHVDSHDSHEQMDETGNVP